MSSFTSDFENNFGESNMVFNVHLLDHICECVEKNGSLCCYSTYNMEDNIGHLTSFVHGTTDVLQQICNKYVLEKNLIPHIQKSEKVSEFMKTIDTHRFASTQTINGHTLVGNGFPLKNRAHFEIIKNYFQLDSDIDIVEFRAILLGKKVYYESNIEINAKKRTCDSFVSNELGSKFADLVSIFSISENVYFLINEKYTPLTIWKNMCEHVVPLKIILDDLKIVQASYFGSKYALISTITSTACAKFPNLYERN